MTETSVFIYSDMEVKVDAGNNRLFAIATITNTGVCDAQESVQCYISTPDAEAGMKLMTGYQISIPAGDSQRITQEVPFERLGTEDEDGQVTLIPGEYTVYVGGSAAECLSQKVKLFL